MKKIINFLSFSPFSGERKNPLEGMTALEILKAIDNWAADNLGNYESKVLWDILTALRGPDSGDSELKWNTTAIIRAYTLPILATGNAMVNKEQRINETLSKIMNYDKIDAQNHFKNHIRDAIHAIPLLNERIELYMEEKLKSIQNISSPQKHS